MTNKKNHIAARSLAKFSALIIVLSFVFYIAWQYIISSPNSGQNVSLTIPSGSSALKIGQILYDNNLIRSPRVFQIFVRFNNISLQAGDYNLSPAKLPSIAQALTTGREDEVRITIPEGYRREQIAELLESKLGVAPKDFLAATKELEGYLFPDTYSFAKDSTTEDIIQRLQANFELKARNLNLTHEDVILASIVEREALTPAEKPVVAGILKNRLKDGWALEVDASIQYIMGKSSDWWPTPLLGDRKLKSPYNTYLNRGLPSGPIGNPGLVSLSAVKNSTPTDYYFYLHDKTGQIHYAKTNSEHEANIARYIDTSH
ncbi:MAG: endolytic transglycosylase MltG [Candidatus Moraniibacteriota bacterium]|nr:MAG: endolytic transglycosylase MltG [Candidatus Moranbacteria bacterium]